MWPEPIWPDTAVMWFEVNPPGKHESITVEYRWDPSQSDAKSLNHHGKPQTARGPGRGRVLGCAGIIQENGRDDGRPAGWKECNLDLLEGTVGDWTEWESDRFAVMWFEVNPPGNHQGITVEYRWDPSQSEKPEIREHMAVRIHGYMDDDGRLIEMAYWKDLDEPECPVSGTSMWLRGIPHGAGRGRTTCGPKSRHHGKSHRRDGSPGNHQIGLQRRPGNGQTGQVIFIQVNSRRE